MQGIQPQAALMRAACTMSRLIDCRRPRRLTQEQSASVDDDPSVRSLLNRQEQLKRTVLNATKHPKYQAHRRVNKLNRHLKLRTKNSRYEQ
jgi:hypothetical protein